MIKRWPPLVCVLLLLIVGVVAACQNKPSGFSGQRAYEHVKAQCDFGPRPVGSEANRKTAEYIQKTLERYGWKVELQEFVYQGLPVRNVIGTKGEGPRIILGAHYDTRPIADKDPSDRSVPIMGANDGGSGVGVLLELARVLDEKATGQAEIQLMFFDAEDRGELNSWPWCVGSKRAAGVIVETLTELPKYVIVVDMVGDQDQRIYYEWSSSLWLNEKVWGIAAQKGYGEHFIPQHKYSIVDDHTSFLQWGMTAIDIIDFDYPYWHTRYDTLDKISADSLQRVGDVLEALLEGEPFAPNPETPGSPPKS